MKNNSFWLTFKLLDRNIARNKTYKKILDRYTEKYKLELMYFDYEFFIEEHNHHVVLKIFSNDKRLNIFLNPNSGYLINLFKRLLKAAIASNDKVLAKSIIKTISNLNDFMKEVNKEVKECSQW